MEAAPLSGPRQVLRSEAEVVLGEGWVRGRGSPPCRARVLVITFSPKNEREECLSDSVQVTLSSRLVILIVQLAYHWLVFSMKIFIFRIHLNGLSVHLLNRSFLGVLEIRKLLLRGHRLLIADFGFL